ncbi:hypothetical protein TraAM80_02716 [Trypanosoma rangeli]|uniref:Uncharacterized protein n=1 Tax=Trypanosoma rangeli TaxID=5698 RepID=A0A3S5IRS2_TRYRA|nr:uncharacterized protein TraAM80_02716 [Trypanosoma rangeli]RNF08490.1 hypothetical protein TraAM80_02716 [Trypanosoma rangeli]|eukprot:RNF08490.1 hypothetical protein TraAM80_02716 [Trypanosoma rangeli]
MYGVNLLFLLLMEGLILAVSYVMLFVPLLYFDNRQQCAVYGSVMTVVLTLWSCTLHFFRIIRPVEHLSRSIRQAENVLKGFSQTPASLPLEGTASTVSNPRGATGLCDDLMEERRRVEDTLHSLHFGPQPSVHFLQDHRCAVANLLTAFLQWQQGLIDFLQMKLKEEEKARSCNDFQRSVLCHDSPANFGAARDSGGERRGSLQFLTHPQPTETVFNLGPQETSAPQGLEVSLKSAPLELQLPMSLASVQATHAGVIMPSAARKPNARSPVVSNHVDPAACLDAKPNEESVGRVGTPLLQAQESKTTQTETIASRNNSADTGVTTLEQDIMACQQSTDDTSVVDAVNNNLLSLTSPAGELSIAAARDSARETLENNGPFFPSLRRGERFATDNNNVFFYLIVKRQQDPETIIGFEARFSFNSDRRSREENFTKLPSGRDTLQFAEAMPFEGFALNAKSRRVCLSDAQKMLAGFLTCEVEADGDVGTTNGTLETRLKRSALVGEDTTFHGSNRERAFILSWAALPELPIRLTTLPVNLSPSESCTLPILECLISDVLCILTSAVLFVELVRGDTWVERAVSVELHGVSIEDTSDEDYVEAAAVESGAQLCFGMSVTEVIKL